MCTGAKAMEVADRFRASVMPLKKSEKPRIWCFRTMLETVDAMERMEANLEYVGVIRRVLNMHGRLRCTAGVAADFLKACRTLSSPRNICFAFVNFFFIFFIYF